METFGLLIQGPLVSFGKTGASAYIPEDKLKPEHLVEYDCRDNIRKIIEDFGHLFQRIVISTWDAELRAGDAWRGATIVSTPDPGGIEESGMYKANNKFRQFIGIRNGLVEMERHADISHVVRIRTDQYVDLGSLLRAYKTGITRFKSGSELYVSLMHPSAFLLYDFYFAAKLQVLKDFCDAVLAYGMFEFASNVHREIVLKHAYVQYRNEIGVPDWAYFPAPNSTVEKRAHAATKKIFRFMFTNVYAPLPIGLFRSVVWRGSHWDERFIALKTNENKTRLHNGTKSRMRMPIPALVSIDWRRYAAFQRSVSQRGPSFFLRSRIWFSERALAALAVMRKARSVSG